MTVSHLTETGSGPIPNTRLWHEGYGFQLHQRAWMQTTTIVTPVKFITL